MGVREGTDTIMRLRQLAAVNSEPTAVDPFVPGSYTAPAAAESEAAIEPTAQRAIAHPIPEALSGVTPPLHTRVIAKIWEVIRPHLSEAA